MLKVLLPVSGTAAGTTVECAAAGNVASSDQDGDAAGVAEREATEVDHELLAVLDRQAGEEVADLGRAVVVEFAYQRDDGGRRGWSAYGFSTGSLLLFTVGAGAR